MTEKYCTGCGKEKVMEAKFCGNCGKSYSDAQAEVAATVSAFTAPTTKAAGKPKTIGNIVVNIAVAILVIFSQSVMERHLEWGGGETYLVIILLLLAGLQFFAFVLQKRRKSYSAILPAIISFSCIFPTISLYRDLLDWLEYQGFQTQEAVSGDFSLMVIYIFLYIAIAALNIISLFFRNK
jgi:hypothetical protein